MGKVSNIYRDEFMHQFRSHNCGELRSEQAGQKVKLSGWVHRIRDHGNLIFIDLRDHFGITQCVADVDHDAFKQAEELHNEYVVTVTGEVVKRTDETINDAMPTGEIELQIEEMHIQSTCQALPLQVNSDRDFPEETRLKYRFLDLRREKQHTNIVLRSNIISTLRSLMIEQGFMEIQTPILTSSSPEGARDFLVPSRLHPGQFYALPQAPQQFKQLLMVSGFDKYFQIAPCFRDEDARADRSPGEFYQLDMEMAFATQDDVFEAMEPVLHGTFKKFAGDRAVNDFPFPRIPFHEAMLKYGSDKPDLRNPIEIKDVGEVFAGSNFAIFAKAIEAGSVVRAIPAPQAAATQSRKFFDGLNDWARDLGMPGLGYVSFTQGSAKGPIAKFLDEPRLTRLRELTGVNEGDSVFFVCDKPSKAAPNAGQVRNKLGESLDLIDKSKFIFCWIVDFPMYEADEETGKIDFSHNPFSMPQGGLEALESMDPLDVKAYQYDIVCNGHELCSGAIRNHLPDLMYKAFEIAGYSKQDVETEFGGMLNAFKFGAPPHGGCAPGVDRIVMLLADEPNLREIVAFPMNQQAQDILMGAPGSVALEQLNELHIQVKMPIKAKAVGDNS